MYPQHLLNIIYDPNNYFYFHGLKCCNLDIVYGFKKKRNEIPKDINDIELINKFNKLNNLNKNKLDKIFNLNVYDALIIKNIINPN